MTFRPLRDNCLVLRADATEKVGSLFVAEVAKEKPAEGTVVSVGPGKLTEAGRLVETTVQPGQRVMFGKYSGTEIQIDGVAHVLLKEEEIVGIWD